MAGKNLHSEPFDDGTLLKLDIFHKYLKEWIPVFFNWRIVKEINIVDFFAGQGKDITGQNGSPLIIIETLLSHAAEIKQKGLKVRVILNELDVSKYDQLLKETSSLVDYPFELIIENKTFIDSFNNHYNKFLHSANFIFLDQNGIKEITEGIFSKLTNLKLTDILFFISSSYLYRFNTLSEFKKYIDTHKIAFNSTHYHSCHRAILNFYKEQIANEKEYYLGPFSLKKGSNIYGLIFGSNHTYGIEKFLKICWTLDKQRGEANYDIDSDNIHPTMPSLFEDLNIPKKVQNFEKELEIYIKSKEIHLLKDIYKMGLDRGFLPKHVNKVINDLKTKSKINFNSKLISSKIHTLEDTHILKNSLWRNQG